MGCFNSVLVDCPHCGSEYEEQSKAGDCSLRRDPVSRAPLMDLAFAASMNPHTCGECGGQFDILVQKLVHVEKAQVDPYD